MVGTSTAVLASVAAVSLLALVGIAGFSLGRRRLEAGLPFLVSFSAGTLLGDAFLHLLPETAESVGFGVTVGGAVLAGLFVAFVVENYIAWHHHHGTGRHHPRPLSYMILFGDGVHNFIDGVIIATSYLVSIPLGIATTLAIAFHEVPQEVGDFGVLVYGGLPARRALAYNFATALTAFLGAGLVLGLAGRLPLLELLLPLAAGNFIYIAGSDLLPEIKAERDRARSTAHMATFVVGIAVMYALTL